MKAPALKCQFPRSGLLVSLLVSLAQLACSEKGAPQDDGVGREDAEVEEQQREEEDVKRREGSMEDTPAKAGAGGGPTQKLDPAGPGAGGAGGSEPAGPDEPEPQSEGQIVPLYDERTMLEIEVLEERDDALITRFGDRGRDRHARENEFSAYDHYLKQYWEDRTVSVEIVDTIAQGGESITFNVETQYKLHDNQAELRFFYRGVNTVAEYHNNGVMTPVDDLHYVRSVTHNAATGEPLVVGDHMEFELSQFLDPSVEDKGGRANYYGTTFLYVVGEGLLPWQANAGENDECPCEGEISTPIPEQGWLGGRGTLPYQYSDEPTFHLMQMMTNLSGQNAQPFVLGRRIVHTDFSDGQHDEDPENPIWSEQAGKLGPLYINHSCDSCHKKNGRSPPPSVGEKFEQYVFRVGDREGNPHPELGHVLQSGSLLGQSEGAVILSAWREDEQGLRRPEYSFEGLQPDSFSARSAPQLTGMGLLEAISESTLLEFADPEDKDKNGISGRSRLVIDPVSGDARMGRFGWKAGQATVRQQLAAALNTDMGVMTSIFPTPDCGAKNSDCGDQGGAELADEELEHLTKYISLLGVRARRQLDSPRALSGEEHFVGIGCAGCHLPTVQTSPFHPYAELRDQTIHPYTDLLLHDMGPGLADNLDETSASGSEWRTAPLWNIGLSAPVSGEESYLHDGRARSLHEAILWHGGEGEQAREAYEGLSDEEQDMLLVFLRSL